MVFSPALLARLPKLELHLHLDCSPSLAWARQFLPDLTPERFRQEFQLTEKCRDLSVFLSRIPRVLDLMQQAQALSQAVDDLFEQLAVDGVIYAEIRFAPLLHLEAGLTPEQVVTAVDTAIAAASARTGIGAGLILCTLRHFSEQQGLTTVALARQFATGTVVGLDLAADEAGFPLEPHVRAFEQAEHWGIARTAHAGEALGAASVRETLTRLRPARIGHGVRAIEDPRLVEQLAKSGVHLEVCPACNVLIDVFERLEDHPVDRLLRAGVSLGINTDGRTIPAVTLVDQYQQLAQVFGWDLDRFRQINRHAAQAAFLPEARKAELVARLDREYALLMENP